MMMRLGEPSVYLLRLLEDILGVRFTDVVYLVEPSQQRQFMRVKIAHRLLLKPQKL
jgi:hypothetical protein